MASWRTGRTRVAIKVAEKETQNDFESRCDCESEITLSEIVFMCVFSFQYFEFNASDLNSTEFILRCEQIERVNVPSGISLERELHTCFMRVSFVYCITLRSVMISLILISVPCESVLVLFYDYFILLVHLFHFRLLLLPNICTRHASPPPPLHACCMLQPNTLYVHIIAHFRFHVLCK